MHSQSGNKAQSYLRPKIAEEMLLTQKKRVEELVEREKRKPMEHCKFYDKYAFVISKQVCSHTHTHHTHTHTHNNTNTHRHTDRQTDRQTDTVKQKSFRLVSHL